MKHTSKKTMCLLIAKRLKIKQRCVVFQSKYQTIHSNFHNFDSDCYHPHKRNRTCYLLRRPLCISSECYQDLLSSLARFYKCLYVFTNVVLYPNLFILCQLRITGPKMDNVQKQIMVLHIKLHDNCNNKLSLRYKYVDPTTHSLS